MRDGSTPPYRLATALVGSAAVPAAVVGERVIALDALPGVRAPADLAAVLADWPRWRDVVADGVRRLDPATDGLQPDGWGVPVAPSKLVCIGVNYHDHLAEMGGTPPPERPYSFLKPVNTGLVASGGTVQLPDGPAMVDWEAELAVVLGRSLHHGRGEEVLDAVAGYTIYNDLSARDWIASTKPPGIDWVLMKGYDGFSPIGPFVTPAEFVADPQRLGIRCWVNGELKQNSSTSRMIFSVQAILEHLSAIMTLEPGDVIATGTPAGVGYGARPQQFLRDGDRVAVEIDGLGRLETVMAAARKGAVA
jgi:2-keto-4-pentenoate hydratase/2-oxohepta-3-ene-1,7-dioic acid hydratase in catechol pathway